MVHAGDPIVGSIVSSVIEQVRILQNSKRLIIGVSGPQGSGKTTVSRQAAQQLSTLHGIRTLAISLDDFYKPHADLVALSRKGNPLLQHRGLPGTHDTDLLSQFCSNFINTRQKLQVPEYDKSLHGGVGDRLRLNDVDEDVQAIILEGWMLGFQPVALSTVRSSVELVSTPSMKPTETDLEEINQNLSRYCSTWAAINHWIRLVPRDLKFIYLWRLQQERELISSTGQGMTDEQVRNFVDQYMPCYKLYTDTLKNLSACELFLLDETHKAVKMGH